MYLLFLLAVITTGNIFAQKKQTSVSEVWVSDLGNGNYKNPALYADYSDPDVVRVGDDY